MAVKMGRRGVGIELKESYYRQAVKNVKNALENVQPNLFDIMAEETDERTKNGGVSEQGIY